MTVNFADFVVPSPVTLIVDDELVFLYKDVTGNVAVTAPAATVALPVTIAAAALLDVTVKAIPPVGAGDERVMVPSEFVAPPLTEFGLSEKAVNVGDFTVRVAVFVVPPPVAESVTTVLIETGFVGIINVAVVAPVTNAKVDGTLTALDELDSVTV